jgi:hypothetical protein
MFVEVVLGKARDTSQLPDAWRAVVAVLDDVGDRWRGATAGTDESGAFVGLLGFESEEGSRNTLDHLSETAQWTALKRSLLDAEFHECPEVRAFVNGDLTKATSVEITHGRAATAARMTTSFETAARAAQGRSNVVAGLWCWSADGLGASAIYRRSGDGRKAGTAKATRAEPPAVDQASVVILDRPWSVFAFGAASAPGGSKGGRKR